MRFTISGAAAALLLASVAPAGAQAPPFLMGGGTWGGFYLGANVGGSSSSQINAVPPTGGFSKQFSFGGPLGGGTAGFNWQFNPSWVWGLETDMDAAGMSGSANCPRTGVPGANTYLCQGANHWLGTARGRIGYAPLGTNMLIFGTGGVAYGNSVHSVVGPIHVNTTDSTNVGWTVGGGLEDMFAPQWSAKVEYRYVQLTDHVMMHQGLLGVNYHFNAPPPPPAPIAAPAPPPAPPKVFIVFFDWDKDTITPEGHAIIQQAADAFRAGAPVQLQVTGYTDRSGSPGYNQRLSERRANNVAKALAALGVPKEQMIVSGRGENDNRVPTAPGVREPQNRRVEIVAP